MEPMTQCHSSHCAEGAGAVFVAVLIMFVIFVILIITAIMILIACKVFSKAGYSWALGLLMLVPVANIIMPFVLAFSDWPVLKELRSLKQQQRPET